MALVISAGLGQPGAQSHAAGLLLSWARWVNGQLVMGRSLIHSTAAMPTGGPHGGWAW